VRPAGRVVLADPAMITEAGKRQKLRHGDDLIFGQRGNKVRWQAERRLGAASRGSQSTWVPIRLTILEQKCYVEERGQSMQPYKPEPQAICDDNFTIADWRVASSSMVPLRFSSAKSAS